MINVGLLAGLVSFPVAAGAAITWLNARAREKAAISARLGRFAPQADEVSKPRALLKAAKGDTIEQEEGSSSFQLPGLSEFKAKLTEAGIEELYSTYINSIIILFAAPLTVSLIAGWNLFIALTVSLVLVAIPIVYVSSKSEQRRVKFSEQLPDAIDLIVAVLRSGHSVPQAVKSVALEIPSPCGDEFETVLHRINLGQALPESLTYSAKRYRSYELDLMQRAVAIQAEVGGSLAEILDKTNLTLRQRLKLVRQLRVITAQSRLSGRIVACLPLVLAIVLNFLSPGYMQILLSDKLGQLLLAGAIVLEIVGIYVLERMSTMRI